MKTKKVLTIFHTTDIHNKLNGNKLKKIKDLLSSCDTEFLLLDSGDFLLGGNIIFSPFEPVINKISELNYTAIAIGNREFNYFRSVFYNRLKKINTYLLASNLIDLRFKKNNEKIKKNLYLVSNDIRICIIGLTKPQYNEKHFWEFVTGFRFLNFYDSVSKIVKDYYKITDIFIILSHLGITDDINLAKFLKENYYNIINRFLILGGHDHKEFFDDSFIPIIHTEPYLKKITKIELFFIDNKNHYDLDSIFLSRIDL
jgi:2',3'-cyclic-nucleotide 2'-phosphodiesterase (5'-nucleotidase family)